MKPTTTSEVMFGMISRKMIRMVPSPASFAAVM
jgi:hypothetical protein